MAIDEGKVKHRRQLIQERAMKMRDPVDPNPTEWPADKLIPPSFEERMQAFVRGELSRIAEDKGMPTFEEEDDFDIDDEDDLLSPYQVREVVPDISGYEVGDQSQSQEFPEDRPSPPAEPNADADKPPSEPPQEA